MYLERERDSLHRALGTQVVDPLKGMVNGAPLDDARMLTQKYDKLRQEAELQSQEVGRRSRKAKEGVPPPEAAERLEAAEQKMADTARAMAVLGKEAAAAMSAVQAQQQRLTLQRIIAMASGRGSGWGSGGGGEPDGQSPRGGYGRAGGSREGLPPQGC